MNQIKVSFIVCTYSKELFRDTHECIQSLIDLDYEDKEIILVMDKDNELNNLLQKSIPASVSLFVNPHQGLSEARNLGIRKASGDIIVFIDDDAVSDKNYLSNLIINYKEENVVGVAGKIVPKQKLYYPEELFWIGGFTYKGFPEERCEVRNAHGCNMSFRKEVFEKAGLFDTRLGRIGKKLVTAEDTEISIRILNAFPGSKIIYDPHVIVYHKAHEYRQTFSYMVRRGYNEGRSKARIEKLYKNMNGSSKTLSTEKSYFKYLLKKSIPARLKRIFMIDDVMLNAKEVISLITVIASVGIGYSIERMK